MHLLKNVYFAFAAGLFALSSTALAEGPWLVGSTEELESQAYATNALACLDHPSCIVWPGVGNAIGWSQAPWGLGEVDCKPFWEAELAYADQEYQGQSSVISANVVYDWYDLPQVCQTYRADIRCADPFMAELECQFGFIPCCAYVEQP